MELLQLKYFCDAANTENFSRTAQKYGVPPSDISQSIRRLEKELSVNLFTRRANRVSLNSHGAAFYEKVSSALKLLSDAVSETSDDGNKGIINICTNCNRRIVIETAEKFRRQYPEVYIKAKTVYDTTAEEFDLIVTAVDDTIKGYDKRLLISEKLAVAINRDNPLAQVEKFDVSMLADQPFVTMTEQSNMCTLTKSVCADFGFVPSIALQSDDPFHVRRCVELGLGVTIFPVFSWQGQFAENVVLREIEGYTRQTYLFINEKKYMPICTKRFVEMLQKACKQSWE